MASRPGVPEPTILPIVGHHATILDAIAAAFAASRALIARPDLFPAGHGRMDGGLIRPS